MSESAAPMLLTQDEIVQITGRVRRPAQKKELNRMGIISKERADGLLIVSRSHVEKELGGVTVPQKKTEEFKIHLDRF